MGLKSALIRLLEAERQGQRKRKRGPYGDFHRAGGLPLLHDVPVTTEDIVVDAGGFEGDWSAAMILRFGCRCEIFEPVPQLAARCRERFNRNERVHVRQEALGGIDRVTHFSVDALASSEFPGERGSCGALVIEARVVDAAAVVQDLSARFGEVGCLKLNIEGGEYEVLERLIGSGAVA